eukprot:g762.t1
MALTHDDLAMTPPLEVIHTPGSIPEAVPAPVVPVMHLPDPVAPAARHKAAGAPGSDLDVLLHRLYHMTQEEASQSGGGQPEPHVMEWLRVQAAREPFFPGNPPPNHPYPWLFSGGGPPPASLPRVMTRGELELQRARELMDKQRRLHAARVLADKLQLEARGKMVDNGLPNLSSKRGVEQVLSHLRDNDAFCEEIGMAATMLARDFTLARDRLAGDPFDVKRLGLLEAGRAEGMRHETFFIVTTLDQRRAAARNKNKLKQSQSSSASSTSPPSLVAVGLTGDAGAKEDGGDKDAASAAAAAAGAEEAAAAGAEEAAEE